MAKKKIKKFLKKVAPLVVAGLGAAALGRRKGRAQGVSGSDKGLFTSDSHETNPEINLRTSIP